MESSDIILTELDNVEEIPVEPHTETPALSAENDALIHVCRSLMESKRFEAVQRLLGDALTKYRGQSGQITSVDGLVVLREMVELYKHVAALISRDVADQESKADSSSADAQVVALRAQFPLELMLSGAREYFQAAKKILSPDEPSIVQAGNDLAEMLSSSGQDEEAGMLYRFCLRQLEKDLGDYHPDTIASLEVLTSYYSDLKKWPESVILLGKTQNAYKKLLKTLPLASTSSATSPTNIMSERELEMKIVSLDSKISDILIEENYCFAAEPYLKDKCTRMNHLYGELHMDTIQSNIDLATNCIESSKFSCAEQLLTDSLSLLTRLMLETTGNTGDTSTLSLLQRKQLSTMNDLAVLYDNTFDYSKSQTLHEDCIRQRVLVLGKQHPDTLQSMVNFGNMLTESGKNDQAEIVLKDSLAGYLLVISQLPDNVSIDVVDVHRMHSDGNLCLPSFAMSAIFDGLVASVESLFSFYSSLGQTDAASECLVKTLNVLVGSIHIGCSHHSTLALKLLYVKGLIEFSSKTEEIDNLCKELISLLQPKISNYLSKQQLQQLDNAINNNNNISNDINDDVTRAFTQLFEAYMLSAKFYSNLNLVSEEIKMVELCLEARKQYLTDILHMSAYSNLTSKSSSAISFDSNEISFDLTDECAILTTLLPATQEEISYHQIQTQLLDLYIAQQEFEKAVNLSSDCIGFTIRVYGEHAAQSLPFYKAHADSLRSIGRLLEAEESLIASFEICKVLYGEKDINTLSVMISLASVFSEQRKFDTAYELFDVCFNISSSLFGQNDIRSLGIVNNMAICSVELNDMDRAKAQFDDCIASGSEKYGSDNEKVKEWIRDRDRYLPPAGCCAIS